MMLRDSNDGLYWDTIHVYKLRGIDCFVEEKCPFGPFSRSTLGNKLFFFISEIKLVNFPFENYIENVENSRLR